MIHISAKGKIYEESGENVKIAFSSLGKPIPGIELNNGNRGVMKRKEEEKIRDSSLYSIDTDGIMFLKAGIPLADIDGKRSVRLIGRSFP